MRVFLRGRRGEARNSEAAKGALLSAAFAALYLMMDSLTEGANRMQDKMLARVAVALEALEESKRSELADLLKQFSQLIAHEKSENLDKEALLKQILILAEQATTSNSQKKKLLTTSAMIYIGLFSSVRSIGSFLIEHRDRLDSLLDAT